MSCVAGQASAKGGAGSASAASGCNPAAGCGAPLTAVLRRAFAVRPRSVGPAKLASGAGCSVASINDIAAGASPPLPTFRGATLRRRIPAPGSALPARGWTSEEKTNQGLLMLEFCTRASGLIYSELR
jgi:hypothetical protein